MSDDRFELLIATYLDGDQTTGEQTELRRLVLTSPQRRRQFVDQVRLHQGLCAERASPFATLAAVRARCDGPAADRRRAAPWGLIGLAAAALLIAIVLLQSRPPAPSPSTPVSVSGPLTAVDPSATGSVDALPAGELFRAPEPVELRLADGSRLSFAAASELRSPAEDGVWSLLSGSCRVQATAQPADRPLRLRTPLATVAVLGTAFELQHSDATTTLRVQEGRVRLQPRADDERVLTTGESATVVDGRYAAIPATTASEVLRYTVYDPASGRLLDAVGGHDLVADDPDAVAALPGGGFHLQRPAMLTATTGSAALIERLRVAKGLTIEAWLLPTTLDQTGPARLFAISKSQWAANILLGMGGDHPNDDFCWSWRLRCEETPGWGRPTRLTKRGLMSEGWTHLVLTVGEAGEEILYRNGTVLHRQRVRGIFPLWDVDHLVRIGNEADADRPWLGRIALLSLHAGALDAATIAERHRQARPVIEATHGQ